MMEDRFYPDLLVRANLEAPFGFASKQLAEVQHAAERLSGDGVELRGLVVLTVAAVETAFLDALSYYHVARPDSIEVDQASFTRAELLEARAPLDLFLAQAARRIRRLSYGPFPGIVGRFAKTTRLKDLVSSISGEMSDFEQLKDARNCLVHAQVEPNTGLLERPVAGEPSRAPEPLSGDWLVERAASAQALLSGVLKHVEVAYGGHTRIAALRRLWYWMFNSPIMPFERFWVVDEVKDEIVGATGAESDARLSGSERMLHSVWLAHFNQTLGNKPLSMYSLDRNNQRKVLHMLAIADRFRMY